MDKQDKIVRVGILGAAGYTGGELIRLLINHPQVEIVFANSESNAGNKVYDVHEGLLGDTELEFTDELPFDKVDVVFFCFGHGKSEAFLKEHDIPERVKIIDMAQDFRIAGTEPYNGGVPTAASHDFVYGLPETHRDLIAGCQHLANPDASPHAYSSVCCRWQRRSADPRHQRQCHHRLHRRRAEARRYDALLVAQQQYVGL